MNNLRLSLLAFGTALALAGCGGGDSSPVAPVPATSSITGLAATGAALGGAAVMAKCATGAPISATTDAGGAFVLPINGQTFPCMLQVVKGPTTLYGLAQSANRSNVTPVTDLVVSKALGSNPAAAFTAFDSAKGAAILSKLTAAIAYVKAELQALGVSTTANDPLTFAFSVGDADDKALDQLGAKLVAANKKLDELRATAVAGNPFVAGLARGTLIGSATSIVTLAPADIDAATASTLQAIGVAGKAKCSVKFVALNYNTIGVKGEAANASAVMLVPTGTGICANPTGLVAYAKGTDVRKPHTLANPGDGETFLLAAVYAAQGYAVVATDYLGFAQSTYAYHPYLHADSEASSVIDSIRAARLAAVPVGASLSGKVMLTGYSQGGHSSMAAHRAIEKDNAAEINVVAGAHLAGPYNLSGSFKLPNAIAGYQYFVPYLVTAWQKIYGNLYASPSDAFNAPYDSYIETLLPNPTLDFTTLVTTGKLPGGPAVTPNMARDIVFKSAFISDSQTNPNNALFLAGKKNDLLGWNPVAKTLLCGGAGDPTVPPGIHQVVSKADFDSRGLTNVTSVDVDASIQFVYGTNGAAPTDPTSVAFATYYGNYHGAYEPPFCHQKAKAVFDTVN